MLRMETETDHESVLITTGRVILAGILDVPPKAVAVVILANGLGRMKHPIAELFASRLQAAGLATLTVDLLTPDEVQFNSRTSHFSADARFQSERILDVVAWIRENPPTRDLPIVGAGAGAAARGMLRAAGTKRGEFAAIVIDGNMRPEDVPSQIDVPTLLLVEDDPVDIRRAENAMEVLAGPTQLRVMASSDTARALDPFFSDTAGHLAAQWVIDSLRPLTAM